jgi:hypothetical protein
MGVSIPRSAVRLRKALNKLTSQAGFEATTVGLSLQLQWPEVHFRNVSIDSAELAAEGLRIAA